MSWHHDVMRRIVGLRQTLVPFASGGGAPEIRRPMAAPRSWPLSSRPQLDRTALYDELSRRRRHAQMAARRVIERHEAC